MRVLSLKNLLVVALLGIGVRAGAQQVGDRVVMSSANQTGVPVHPADADPSFVRWPNGTTATVTAIGPQSQWRRVEANGVSGWIVRTYLTVLPPESDVEPEAPENELPTYVVGTWNLEWLHNNKQRGFPENTNGGPTYGPRGDDDYRQIAQTIRDRLAARIMVLSEINGATETRSNELDRLVAQLGGAWTYYLAPHGGQQRLAILFDSSAARRNRCIEIAVPVMRVQNKDIFDRDPLVCAFSFLDQNSAARNDLLVVAVHLASGQHLVQNHDSAMALLASRLRTVTTDGTFSSGERDVLVAGDFNASRYDNRIESFWTDLQPSGFRLRTLSPEDGDDYPGTRLAGVPLAPRSQIDYIMASARTGGLIDEIAAPIAQVRVDLLPTDVNVFRRHLSDHIPVTIRIRIVPDDDP